MNKQILSSIVTALTLLGAWSQAGAQTTAFTYQGRLNVSGNPANGRYDLLFQVFDAASAGNSIGGSVTTNGVPVTSGLFMVTLNFGSAPFTGPARWLQIQVSTNGAGAYSTLNPRQSLTPAPYANYAYTAGNVTNGAITSAQLAGGAVNTSQLAANAVNSSKIASGQVVKSLNALRDDVTLVAGANVTLNTVGNSLQISAPAGGLALPYSGTASSSGSIFTLNNSGNGAASEGIVGTTASSMSQVVAVRGTATSSSGAVIGLSGVATNSPDGTGVVGVGGITGGYFTATRAGGRAAYFDGNVIINTGNVGIGTTSPVNKLQVVGDTRIDGRLYVGGDADINGRLYAMNAQIDGRLTLNARLSDGVALYVNDSSGAAILYVSSGPPHQLVMYGNLNVFGRAYKSEGGTSWEIASDRRLKQDVQPYEPGLNEILELRPVRFRYRDDPKMNLTSAHEEVGFIAQEVRQVIPDAVTEGKDGYLTLKADPIHWAAINAIQELNAKLEEQRAENAGLRRRLERLEGALDQGIRKSVE